MVWSIGLGNMIYKSYLVREKNNFKVWIGTTPGLTSLWWVFWGGWGGFIYYIRLKIPQS